MKLSSKPCAFAFMRVDQLAAYSGKPLVAGLAMTASTQGGKRSFKSNLRRRFSYRRAHRPAACQLWSGLTRQGTCVCLYFCALLSRSFAIVFQIKFKSLFAETQPAVFLSNREWQRVGVVVHPACRIT